MPRFAWFRRVIRLKLSEQSYDHGETNRITYRVLHANCNAGVQRGCYVNEPPFSSRVAVARTCKRNLRTDELSVVRMSGSRSFRKTHARITRTNENAFAVSLFSKSSIMRVTRALFCDLIVGFLTIPVSFAQCFVGRKFKTDAPIKKFLLSRWFILMSLYIYIYIYIYISLWNRVN